MTPIPHLKAVSTALLLFALLQTTSAQFAPTTTAATLSAAPSPTNSIGCRLVDGTWACAGSRTATTGGSSTSLESAPTTTTPTRTSVEAAPSPVESEGCTLHDDHWHCDALRSGVTSPTTGTGTQTALGIAPSPTESSGCTLHIDHWHCDESESEESGHTHSEDSDAESSSSSEGGDCIIHVGHTHGDCSAEQLGQCGSLALGEYNTGLHIGAIFIVLITSGIGIMLPLIAGFIQKSKNKKRDDNEDSCRGGCGLEAPEITDASTRGSKDDSASSGFWDTSFFIFKHFGTGIILSTAFIHLLFHGFVMFANECVGHLIFEATAPAISLAAFFLTFLFDFFGARWAERHDHHQVSRSDGAGSVEETVVDGGEKRIESSPVPSASPSLSSSPELSNLGQGGHGGHGGHYLLPRDQHWQVLILEAGIIFHSIMIGVTLGAGGGEGWTTLLIVIVFHQFFEGLALGARISLLHFQSNMRPLAMALAFTLITPIGIAIGVGVHSSFSSTGKTPLLAVGILNAISAGILLYSAAQLLMIDFTSGSLRRASSSRVSLALVSLFLGMLAMSVLGNWA